MVKVCPVVLVGSVLHWVKSSPCGGKAAEETAGLGGTVWLTVKVHQAPLPDSCGPLPDHAPSLSVARESQ